MPFTVIDYGSYLLVQLTDECRGQENPTIEEALLNHISFKAHSNFPNIIIDCFECTDVKKPFLTQLSQVASKMKGSGGIRLINANKNFKTEVLENGLGRVLIFKDSFRGAMADLKLLPKQKSLDVDFVNPFLEATMKVFKGQFGITLTAGKPFLKEKTDQFLMGDASGLIAITSETFSGTLSLSLPIKLFKTIVSMALDKEESEVEELDVEILGEIANMVLGIAKESLGVQGYSIQAALPTCIYGGEHKIFLSAKGDCVVVPFEFDGCKFHIEILKGTSLKSLGILKKVGS